MLVFGTRPEAIKMATLVYALKAQPSKFKVQICVTAQHRQMLDQVLKIFKIKPDIDLNLMTQRQDLFDITSSILSAMRNVLVKHKPDIVLVQGDTTTTLATSIASFYMRIPIGHIESGLRTFNINSPFPEEFNRQISSRVANWHFAPTELCKNNLLAEGVKSENITITGNTVVDSLNWILARIDRDANLRKSIEKTIDSILSFDWRTKKFILITGHRRENFGDGFISICAAIKKIALRYDNIHFVYPVHLNPNVQKPVNNFLTGAQNIHLIKPQEYEIFIYLMKKSYFILTDSGGIQEEAPSLGKPVLVMRDATERAEAIQAGTAALVGSSKKNIIDGVSRLLNDNVLYKNMLIAKNPYGDGQACKRILKVLNKITQK